MLAYDLSHYLCALSPTSSMYPLLNACQKSLSGQVSRLVHAGTVSAY